MNLADVEYRRSLVKTICCNHKIVGNDKDKDGFYSKCEKNNKECLVLGRCPKGGK